MTCPEMIKIDYFYLDFPIFAYQLCPILQHKRYSNRLIYSIYVIRPHNEELLRHPMDKKSMYYQLIEADEICYQIV